MKITNVKTKMNTSKNTREKGITLIALVVTIIILLILAGVTLNLVLSNNGLIGKAKQGVDKYQKASQNEQSDLDKLEELIKEAGGENNDTNNKYEITFDANGGTFQNGNNTNKVQTSWQKQNVTKYSHTVNINDSGIAYDNYPEGQDETTEKRDVGTHTNQSFYVSTDIVTIPEAESLNITITYGTEAADSDGWGDTVEIIDKEGNVIEKLSGGATSHVTKTYTVSGDSVEFKFTSDPSVAYYGYYAIVTGNGYTNSIVEGEEIEPLRGKRGFLGWYTDQELENKYDKCNKLNSNITLYAKWDSWIGKYVKYEPDNETYSKDLLGVNYTGSDKNSSDFKTEEYTSGWRILDYDDETGEMIIVMAQPTKYFYFQGATGYNNGVDILNDMCAKLFSKKTNGWNVVARSMTKDDIIDRLDEKSIEERKSETYTKYYDDSNKGENSTNRKYPTLYAKEIGSGTDRNRDNKGGRIKMER